jgi:hypothetical protein
VFLSAFVPLDSTPLRCAKCGTTEMRPGDKYCRPCLSLISRVRNSKKKKEESVLTTSSSRVIEDKIAAHPEPPVSAPPTTNGHHTQRWLVRGRRVVIQEQEYEVDAADLIGVAAELEALAPGLEVTAVQLLD